MFVRFVRAIEKQDLLFQLPPHRSSSPSHIESHRAQNSAWPILINTMVRIPTFQSVCRKINDTLSPYVSSDVSMVASMTIGTMAAVIDQPLHRGVRLGQTLNTWSAPVSHRWINQLLAAAPQQSNGLSRTLSFPQRWGQVMCASLALVSAVGVLAIHATVVAIPATVGLILGCMQLGLLLCVVGGISIAALIPCGCMSILKQWQQMKRHGFHPSKIF